MTCITRTRALQDTIFPLTGMIFLDKITCTSSSGIDICDIVWGARTLGIVWGIRSIISGVVVVVVVVVVVICPVRVACV